ncbi:MAG: 50S ribosomal protein L3 [Acidiferrobacteraceae bacterium]|jgi:large subunit ribosomal protein L3
MATGIVGRKIGMTRVFAESGAAVPVTVLDVAPNRVTQLRTEEVDGYRAVQVTVGERRPGRVNKAMAGHFAKSGAGAGRGVWEFRLDEGEDEGLEAGGEIRVDMFQPGQKVDVQGTTIGKGFAGVIKRHHFGGGRASHGNSLNHRTPGSIGQNQTPGRVFKGKRMSGHLGNVTRTQQGLEVVRVDPERNLLLVKGSIPGPKGADVIIRPSVKARKAVAGEQG